MSEKLTLSFNESGAWRKVLDFDMHQLESIKQAATTLLRVTHRAKGRITAPDGDVMFYAEPFLWQWMPPKGKA